MKLLLLSNSTNYGQPYLEHARDEILSFLDGTQLTFVPYAKADHDGYASIVRHALEPVGITVTSVHEVDDPRAAIAQADNVFVGGGNTFLLVKTLHGLGLMDAIRSRVRQGMPYMGASAGTNIAAPSLRTTNDMPIVEPSSFETLDFLPFQINPHFLDDDPASQHKGETRLERLSEFTEQNQVAVLGLREGTWLRVEDKVATIGGSSVSAFSALPAVLIEGTTVNEVSGDVSHVLTLTPAFDTKRADISGPTSGI